MDKLNIRQYLIVSLAETRYALDIGCALEIIDPKHAKMPSDQIQTMPAKFPFQENMLPVIDTIRHIKGQERKTLEGAIVVITENGREKAALIVDSADEILRVGSDKIRNLEDNPDDPLSELLDSHIVTDDQNIPVLNIERIYKLSGVIS